MVFFFFLKKPMHVGFTSDEGGNTIDLRWYKHKSNLHHVSFFFCLFQL